MPRKVKPTRPLTDDERAEIRAELDDILRQLEDLAPMVGAAIAELRPSQSERYARILRP